MGIAIPCLICHIALCGTTEEFHYHTSPLKNTKNETKIRNPSGVAHVVFLWRHQRKQLETSLGKSLKNNPNKTFQINKGRNPPFS